MVRLLIIYDISVSDGKNEIGWAYWRRAKALQKYAPDDFQVDCFQFSDVPWHHTGEYDLVYNLEYAAPSRDRICKSTPLAVSFNSDSRRRRHFWPPVRQAADFVIFNNVEAFEHYGRPPDSCCISNGVDTDTWRVKIPVNQRPHRLLWCGSTGPTKGKGWKEVFQPLMELAPQHGFECDFRPVNDINFDVVYPTEETVEWYNSGSYILCASISEGTPNISLEGVACGCVLVTVPVGNVQEFGRDRGNCVLVERYPQTFIEGLHYAREHRERLSAAGVDAMHSWSYGHPGNRAEIYFDLFRKLARREEVEPFRYDEKSAALI